jgi:hypothetical protein
VRDNPHRPRDYRPQGLTVVPQDRFDRPGRVNVPRTPITTVPPVMVHNVPTGAPPAAPVLPNRPNRPDRPDRDGDGIRGPVGIARMEGRHVDPGRERRIETARAERDEFIARRQQGQVITAPPLNQAPAQGLPVTSPTPHLPPQPLSTVTSPAPHLPPQALSTASPTIQQPQAAPPAGDNRIWLRDRMERDARRDERREQFEEMRRNRQPVQPQVQPQPQPMMAAQQPQPQPQPQPRFERPAPAPAPVQMAPRPAPAAAPAPAPAPAPAKSEERRRVDVRGRDQKER